MDPKNKKLAQKRNASSEYKEVRAKYYITPEYKASVRKHNTSLKAKHARLKKQLLKERVVETDPLFSLNFYAEIIKDGLCHYCQRSLNPFGHGLDRVKNELGHVSNNVVPCCAVCNTIKGAHFSYDEMMLLVPTLRAIRKQQEKV